MRTPSVIFAALTLTWVSIDAKPSFVTRIPNGSNVKGVPAVGHADKTGESGDLDAFGEAFQAVKKKWTVELCQADSDGDGVTNGEELGDPCCVWGTGDAPAYSEGLSDPGSASSKADPSLWKAVTCPGSNFAATSAPSAATSAPATSVPASMSSSSPVSSAAPPAVAMTLEPSSPSATPVSSTGSDVTTPASSVPTTPIMKPSNATSSPSVPATTTKAPSTSGAAIGAASAAIISITSATTVMLLQW